MLSILAFLFAFNAKANDAKILVMSPQAPEGLYREILSERLDLTGLLQHKQDEYESLEVRAEIFELADQCLGQNLCEGLKDHMAHLREKILLGPQEAEMLKELWQKSGKKLDCYWQSLERSKTLSCGLKKLSLEKLGLTFQSEYLILIDGRIFKPGDEIALLPQKKYHWKILTPRYQAQEFWATMEEVPTLSAIKNPYVTGGCLASTVAPEIDPELKQSLWVAYDKTCLRPITETFHTPPPSESWFSKNKNWVIPSLVIFGGAALYLRDKEIEFR